MFSSIRLSKTLDRDSTEHADIIEILQAPRGLFFYRSSQENIMSIQRLHSGPRMSQAVKHGATLYLAGQVAKDEFATIEVQTQQVLDKMDALMAEAGTAKSKLLSVQVLLTNIADFAAMNSVYDAWINSDNPPARACFEARLASPNLRVEIIAVAALD